jgi:capsid protein
MYIKGACDIYQVDDRPAYKQAAEEEHSTSKRVWAPKEDHTFRDIMAVQPRGTPNGVSTLMKMHTGRDYDAAALRMC